MYINIFKTILITEKLKPVETLEFWQYRPCIAILKAKGI